MNIPTPENKRVKLSPLNLENYKQLLDIVQQKKLVQYSPSKIDTPENLKAYVQRALDGFKRSTCCYGILAAEWDGIKNTVFKEF